MSQTQISTRFVFGILWALLGQVLAVLFGLVSTAILARIVSASELGVYFLASSFIILYAAVFQLGMGKAATLLIAGALAQNDQAKAWATVRAISFISISSIMFGSVFFYFIGFDYLALNFLDSTQFASLKFLLLLWGGLFSLRTILLEIYRGFHDIKYAVLFGEPFTKLIFAVSLSVIWVVGLSVNAEAVIIIILVSVLFSVVLSIAILLIRSRKYRHHTSIKVPLKSILVISLPFLVINLTNMAFGQASIWIVGSVGQEQEVALYGAAMRLAAFVSVPMLLISSVIPPMIVELYTNNSKQRMEALLQTSATISVIPAGILLALFVFFGKEILALIYGDYYIQAHLMLVVLSAAQFIYVFTGPSGLSLAMTKHQNSLMIITCISLVLLILGGIAAGNRYGTIGVAISSGCVMSIYTVATLLVSKWKIGVWAHAGISCLSVDRIKLVRDLVFNRLLKK